MAGSGSRHLGGATPGCRSSGHGSFSNSMCMRGSIQSPVGGQIPSISNLGQFSNIPSSRGGQIPSISNVGQFSNIGSNIPSSSYRKQFFRGISDNAAAVLANLDGQSRALTGGTYQCRHQMTWHLSLPTRRFCNRINKQQQEISLMLPQNPMQANLLNEINAPN